MCYFKYFVKCLVLLVMTTSVFGQTYNPDAHIFTKELVVKFKQKAFSKTDFILEKDQKVTGLEKINTQLKEARNYLQEFGKVTFKKVFTDVEWGDTLAVNKKGKKVKIHDLSQFYTITFPKPVKMWKTINELHQLAGVEHADPPIQIVNDIEPDDLHGKGNQWYLPKINAADAWDISTGSNTVKIAIIDEGVDHNHSDLDDKLIGGENTYSGDHGTKVAGVAGAETNNGNGIASLGWNVTLVPYDDGNSGWFDSDINDARTQDNVDVINCSWRIVAIDPSDNTKYINYDYSPIRYAISNAITASIVVVASAGNPPGPIEFSSDGVTRYPSEYPPFAQYPAAYNGVIAVSATNSSDGFPSGYNYGSHVDVSAPSIDILTTDIDDKYVRENGTSFGSPLTAALAGLCLSINPDLNNTDVETIIKNSAFDLGASGRDDHFGHGRIDAFEALKNTPTWNNVIKNDMYGYNGGNIKFEYTGYNSPYTIPEYFWQEIVAAEKTQTHDGIDYLFSHWDDGEKNYSRDLTLTNNGEYTAVYTGHLHSQSNTAVATGGSRKVWTKSYWNPDLGGPGYRVVYEDNGEIYYTEYYLCTVIPGNPFYMWTDERLISDGSGNSKYPSLAVSERGECCIVWQQFVPSTGKYQILYRLLYEDEAVVITDQSTSNISRPVVGVSSGCRGMGLYYSCYFHFIWDNGNGLKFYSTNNYGIIDIPNTNSSSHNPTITNDQHFYIDKIAYAWEQNGDIYFQQIGFDYSPQDYPVENITSSYSDLRDCHAPSIALSSANGNIMLSWYGEYPYMPCIESIIDAIGPKPQKWFDSVFAIKKESYGNWGYLKRFLHDGYLTYTPSVGSAGYNFSLMWKVINQNLLGKIDYIEEQGWDSNSDLEEFLIPGIKHPSISSGSSNAISAVWSNNISSPYSIHHQVFDNPSQTSMAKSGSNNLKNVQNKIYRSAAINLTKLNPYLKGIVTVNISHPRLNSQYISFSPDSLSHLASIFNITDDFIINSDADEIEFDLTIFANKIEIPAFLDNFEIFCLELNTKENSPLSSNIPIESIYLSDLITGEDQNIYMKKTIKFSVPYSDKKSYQVNGSFFSSIGNLIKPEICDHFYLKSKYIMDNEQNDNKSNTEELVTKFILHGASPNPFNPTTKISFNLPLPSHVKLSVYNIRGQFIKTLINEFKDEGSHSVTFDGSNLASGIYFYIFDAGKFTDVKRILLIK